VPADRPVPAPVRAWRATPLWLRLISATLALVALGLLLTGAFGVRLLRGYLVDRVDEQLADGVEQMRTQVQQMAEMPTTRSDDVLYVPSQFDVTVLSDEGRATASQRSGLTAARPDVPDLTFEEATERAGRPFTVDTARGAGSWRAVALPYRLTSPSGERTGTIVVATSLDEVDSTVKRLVQIDVIVGLAVLAGLAIVGFTLVRTALRPLGEIELTAAAIGRGDLGRRVPHHHPGTEMGRLSRALNAMLEQIERGFRAQAASEAGSRRSEQRMRRFIADASHELRTPLTSIRGFAELYRQGAVTEPEQLSRLVARIESEAERMGVLVDDLLLLARLDQQRPMDTAAVDLREVAGAAVEAARAAAPDRDVVLETPTDPLVVSGDRVRLHQVMTNLLDNALAYSPAGSPVTVRLGAVPDPADGGSDLASIEVVDRGPGLTPDQADRVFERFYRIDPARSRARGGTGLGLSIVAAITAAHHGTVSVDSTPGEGSTFRVLLPHLAEDEPEAPAIDHAPAAEPQPPEAPPPAG
jgi:two-component system OmpR family sensor kinase